MDFNYGVLSAVADFDPDPTKREVAEIPTEHYDSIPADVIAALVDTLGALNDWHGGEPEPTP